MQANAYYSSLLFMPLKHRTETRLVVLLGAMMAFAGIVTALLPDLPEGIVQWVLVFALSFVYPLLLYPLLKRNRADYEFRLFHWVPTGLLFMWFVLQVIGTFFGELSFLGGWYAWSWTLVFTTLGFFFLILFCLNVIRQRVSRIFLLGLLFIPYATFGFLSEQDGYQFDQKLSAMLWDHEIWTFFEVDHGTGSTERVIAERNNIQSDKDERNLASSDDPSEEAWRESLRRFQRRMEELKTNRLGIGYSSEVSSVMPEEAPDIITVPKLPDSLKPGGTGTHMREVATTPNSLPKSGFGWDMAIIALIALYCGVLHDRMRRRA